MKVRLSEIFTSIEGEGMMCGTKTLFVRLAGCPFRCFYCDTKESLPLDSGTEYTVEEACGMIDASLEEGTFKTNFTGGDPLMQHQALARLAEHVQGGGMPTYLESSCFDADRFRHVLPYFDMVKIEFKTEDSMFVSRDRHGDMFEQAAQCMEAALAASKTTYIKIVVSARTDLGRFGDMVRKIAGRADPDKIVGFVLQPSYGTAEPSLDLLMNLHSIAAGAYPDARVIPQMHKLIGAP